MNNDLIEKLNKLLEKSVENVRPSDKMVSFYNFIGRLPLKTGALLLLLTSLDAIKVMILAGILQRTDAALQIIYDIRFKPWRLFWAFGDRLWNLSYNCRSVRSRGLFVQGAMKILISRMMRKGDHVIVSSLGSGSANQLLQGVLREKFDLKKIKIALVDRDSGSLKRGVKYAEKIGISESVNIYQSTAGKYLENTKEQSVNLFEIVGLVDYFDDSRLERHFNGVYRSLKTEGFFLGANISSFDEKSFAHGAACWPSMHYRSKRSLQNSLEKSGFNSIWIGDCGLYTVWVAQK